MVVKKKLIWLFPSALAIAPLFLVVDALTSGVCRRDAVVSAAAVATAAVLPTSPALADGLASKLAKRDPAVLKNSVFNIPPAAQVYPSFMRGKWSVTSTFNSYIFPSDKISKERLVNNFDIPGFQKCSIAAVCDVGKSPVDYEMRIDGLQDRVSTLKSQIDAYLGYPAVAQVIYDAPKNPNRISVDFIDYKTRNAERIELFCNARESEQYEKDGSQIFVCSEYIRQVTFSGSADVGVARQVVGNYAHFWTWKEGDGPDKLTGNLLTACYLDPQDAMFFEEPSKPVAIYSHVLAAKRI